MVALVEKVLPQTTIDASGKNITNNKKQLILAISSYFSIYRISDNYNCVFYLYVYYYSLKNVTVLSRQCSRLVTHQTYEYHISPEKRKEPSPTPKYSLLKIITTITNHN